MVHGKSNVADAVRWVLGEQSMKTLRSQKSEDVIFSGTELRKSLGFAEVKLFFDNSSHIFNIDYDEVIISRRIFRDQNSIYSINGKECKLKTIQELFMDTGIGKDGYSIIGQGKIDEILSNKSEERRSVFEEAAGIVKYRTRKEEAEKKIEKSKLNLQRVEDILKEINSNLEVLEKQSEKAKKFLNARDELKIKEVQNFCISLKEFEKEGERIKSLLDEIKDTYLVKEKDVLEKTKELENLKNRVNAIALEIESIQKKDFETRQDINNKINTINFNIEKNNELSKEEERLNNEKQELNKKSEEILLQIKEKKEDVLRYTNDEKEFKERLSKKEDTLAKLQSGLNDKILEVNKIKEEIEEKREEKFNLENVYNKICLNVDNTKQILKQNEKDIRECISELDNIKMSKEDENSEHLNVKNEKDEYTKKVITYKKVIDDLSKKIEQMKGMYIQINTRVALKESRIQLLTNLEKEKEGFTYAIKKLLEEKDRRTNYGRVVDSVLADILSLDLKYKTAIEMALGFSLQNIIVEKAEDAKQLIEFLKINKHGRASFLPIDTIKGKKINIQNVDIRGLEENVIGVAADLVSYDKKYENIVFYLLGKIVIVDNNDTALKLSRMNNFNFKVITLDGDVINPSGSITGGYVNETKGKVLGRKKEIEELKSDLELDYSRQKKLENSIEKLKQEKDVNLVKFEQYDGELKTLMSKYELFFGKQEIYDKEIDKLNAKLKILRQEKETREKELEDLVKQGEKANSDNEEIDKKIKELEEVLKNKKGIDPEEERNLENLTTDIMNLKISLSSFEESKKPIQDMIVLLEESHNENINLNKKNDLRIEEIRKSRLKNEEENKKLEQEIQSVQNTNDDFEKETKGLREERENNNLKISELEKELVELKDLILDIKDRENKIEFEKEKLNIKKDNTIIYMWEEYEITANSDTVKNCNIEEVVKKNLEEDIKKLKNKIKQIGSVNLDAIEEYSELKTRSDFLTKERQDLIQAIDVLKNVIIEMQRIMKQQFKDSFKKINENFEKIFKELFAGGRAKIELENESEPLTSGIKINVQPPGKKLINMGLLSGGERALTAIALLFAILSINPSPFCILDEIEAALDDANVLRFARFLKKYAENTQFLVITHRKGTMEIADNIYGITMQESGISKTVSINLEG